jgi:retron-type reverse transcriptase
MKRYGELFEKIYDFDNLERAYRAARRGKRYRAEVLRYTQSLEENLIDLQNSLIWHTYTLGQHRRFTVTYPKLREISALPFRDRVAQHAVVDVVEPLLDRRFYYHSYACRAGKGSHKASAVLSEWVRALSYEARPLYALKADIHQYFKSIDHHRLKAALRRMIKDPDVLWFFDLIIDNGGAGGRGVPVGNLTSQLFANAYLDALDQYVKSEMRVKWYMRYMDDFVILSYDKDDLRAAKDEIEAFLRDRLALALNPKTGILCASNGIDFCGYRHFRDHKRVRRRALRVVANKIKAYRKGRITRDKLSAAFVSWCAHAAHADSYRLRERVRAEFNEAIGNPGGDNGMEV